MIWLLWVLVVVCVLVAVASFAIPRDADWGDLVAWLRRRRDA